MPDMVKNCVSKLREFVAHSDNVNSVCIGPKTGQLVATGGADKQVHLWTLARPNCLVSFSGHTTPVVCVQWSLTENYVCAGAQAGAIKLYDVASGKLSRTLMGHRAGIRTIEFHPDGNIFISSSADSILKLWDTRRRGNILSCKGHSSAINDVKFSSHGSWFASASDDHKVKIWELRKGQVFQEFSDPCGSVVNLTFHPNLLKLASASEDGVLKCYNLETFTVSSSITLKRRPFIHRLHSCPEGNRILGGSEEQLLMYGWDSTDFSGALDITWGRIQSMQIAGSRLTAVSSKRTHVSIYSVDLDTVEFIPTILDPLGGGDRLLNSQFLHPSKQLETAKCDHTTSQTIFKPLKSLSRTPPTSARHVLRSQDVAISRNEFSECKCGSVVILCNDGEETEKLQSQPTVMIDLKSSTLNVKSECIYSLSSSEENGSSPGSRSQSGTTKSEAQIVSNNAVRNSEPERQDPKDVDVPDWNETADMGVRGSEVECKTNQEVHSPPGGKNTAAPVDLSEKTNKDKKWDGKTAKPIYSIQKAQLPQRTVKTADAGITIFEPEKPVEVTKRSEPEKTVADFSFTEPIVTLTPMTSAGSETDVLGTITRDHPLILTALRNRQKNLMELHQVWKTKNVRATSEIFMKFNDMTTATDFIGILVLQPARWTLDLCVMLLPTLVKLIQSRHEYHIATACDALRRLLKTFGVVINTTVSSPVETLGVDLCQEERYQKCLTCHEQLQIIQGHLANKHIRGKVGLTLEEVNELLFKCFN